MGILLPTILLLSMGALAYNPDHWHHQILFGEAAIIIWLAAEIWRKFNLLPALLYSFVGCYGVYLSIQSPSAFNVANPLIEMNYDISTSRSVVFFLLSTVPFIFCEKEQLKNWLFGFKAFAFISAILMIFHRFTKPNIAYNGGVGFAATGFLDNPSMDATFIALVLPLILLGEGERESRVIMSVIILIAVAASGSSIGYGVVCLEVLLFFVIAMKKSLPNILFLIGGAMATVPLGYLLMGKFLFVSNGRPHFFQLTWDTFVSYGNYWLGNGTGSYIIIMPEVQKTIFQNAGNYGLNAIFIWAHNDPLQVLFEQGIIGVSLVASVFFLMAYKNRKNMVLFLTIMAAGFESFLQMPLRHFPVALFLAFICRISFEENDQLLSRKESLYEQV